MNLFPTYLMESLQKQTKNIRIPREYEIDFKTGQLTGRIVEKKEAVKMWIWLALQVPRYRFFIYSWDYGCDYEELIGKVRTKEYIKSETRRMTEECLLINEDIKSISNFSAHIEGDDLLVSFTAHTVYGSVLFQDIKVA